MNDDQNPGSGDELDQSEPTLFLDRDDVSGADQPSGHGQPSSAQPEQSADAGTGSYPPPAVGAVPSGVPGGWSGAPYGGPSAYAGTSPQTGAPAQPVGPYGTGAYPAMSAQAPHAGGPGTPVAPGTQPAGAGRPRNRGPLSGWFWPTLCVMTLIVGLLGGALGGVLINKIDDARAPDGRAGGGLADVSTVSKAPLPDNGSVAAVAQKMLPSTVQIIAQFGGDGATGSGFFLDTEGHVVTNNHVVAAAADKDGKIQVVDHNRKRYEATVVGRSAVYDLAVLYVKGVDDITPAALGSSQGLNVGETVVAIGSPLGLDSTVTSGIVSALNRPVTTGNSRDDQSYINAVQTDAAINPGNSGGPLVNLAGQVVGVNSAIATTGGSIGGESGNIGVGFAIPIEQVMVTADQILKDGKARYPVIGAEVSSDNSGDGAHIQRVVKGQPADKAGLKKGDVVSALNDRPVTDSPTLIVAIRSHLPGETVKLTVQRGGKELKLDITLDSKVG